MPGDLAVFKDLVDGSILGQQVVRTHPPVSQDSQGRLQLQGGEMQHQGIDLFRSRPETGGLNPGVFDRQHDLLKAE